MKILCLILSSFFVPFAARPASAADVFPLRDDDRVVFVGSTLIEREQRYGYWETALTRRYSDKNVIFRNLGWSGDTVFGDARAGFGTQADGFRQLKDHVLALKPTVLIIGYGTNESFAGPMGLPRFRKGLETLLDTFAPTKARIVLLSPLKHEKLAPPLPDPTEQNQNLRLYADAIRDTAKKRGHCFVDLFELLGHEKHPLTDNGIHLTAYGYWRSSVLLARLLNQSDRAWKVEIDAKGNVGKTEGVRVDNVATEPLRFRIRADVLPCPPPPEEESPKDVESVSGFDLCVKEMPRGIYQLRIDDASTVQADEKAWAAGVGFRVSPDRGQVERLRRSIIAKNRLYFYRWRPENETYLFGFRKHEQGQNAREIPQFDPLIAEKEKEIAKLRMPSAHTYELKKSMEEPK